MPPVSSQCALLLLEVCVTLRYSTYTHQNNFTLTLHHDLFLNMFCVSVGNIFVFFPNC